MSRLLDHKKQYACMEVFRLENLQTLAEQMEDIGMDLPDETRLSKGELLCGILDASRVINEFIKYLEEQVKK